MATNYGRWSKLAYKDFRANPKNYTFSINGPSITELYMMSKNGLGISKINNPFSRGNIGSTALSLAPVVIGAADKALNKGVSNTTGNVLSGVGGGLMAIPTPYTLIAGAALMGAGLIANGLTDRVNTGYQKAKHSEINSLGNTVSTATNFADLDAEKRNWGTVDIGDLDNWGDIGFLSSGSKVKGARNDAMESLLVALNTRAGNWTSRANGINFSNTMNLLGRLSAYGGFLDSVDPSTSIGYAIFTDKYVKDKSKGATGVTPVPNFLAFGGDLQTMGADFPTGLVHIGTGNTHELNPYGGVQVGTDQEGTPNLVEEGETIYDDYVFSNRLIVPRGMRGNYGKRNKYAKGGKLDKGNSDGQLVPYELEALRPFEGLTFADAAKKAEKLSGADERPTDPIAQRGLLAMLQVLAGTQEKEREKEKLQEIKDAIDNMTPEEFAMLLQLMQANQQLANDLVMLEQLQMIPQGMEYMQLQPVELPIAALGGLLDTYDNTYAYGGNLKLFREDLKDANVSEEDYLRAFYNMRYDKLYEETQDKDNLLSKEEFVAKLLEKFKLSPEEVLNDENFNKDFAETFLNRVETITRQYNRRAKKQGIKADDLQGATKAQYNRELKQAIQKGVTDADYNVSQDTELTFNNSSVSTAKNKQQAYSNAATYNDLIARGGRAIELDDLGRPTWESIAGLNKIDNSAEGFYDNLGELNEDALSTRGVYDYNAAQKSSIDVDDYNNVKLRGWNKNEDGTYTVSSEYDNPNQTSLSPGNSDTTYPIADIGDLKSGSDEYKEALKAILDNEDYKKLTDYIAQALEDAKGKVENLSPDVLNYVKYLDANSGNIKGKLLNEDGSLSATAAKDYRRRREDYQYGIYHYQFDNSKGATATRYYRKDKDKEGKDVKVYISKPEGTDFTISENPIVTTGTDGTLFNDYEVTGLNKNRILTLLPTGEVVDVTNINDINNWTKLDKPVLVDNTDNLGYGINGTTNWVDYGSSPGGASVTTENDPFPKAPSWPYLLGAGLQLGSLGYNILSPADYSNADAMISAAKEAGTFTPIGAMFAGLQLPYKPAADTLWGKLQALTLGNARNIINNSRGNLGATIAGLLGNTYAGNIALGDAHEKWRQGNWNMLKDVQTFGLQRDTSNYDRLLKAEMSNQDAEARARGYKLEGLKSGYAMRQAIDDAKANAINAGLTGLGATLFNYALNKYNQDMLGWGIRNGAYAPLAGRANGGRIRRYKGLTF